MVRAPHCTGQRTAPIALEYILYVDHHNPKPTTGDPPSVHAQGMSQAAGREFGTETHKTNAEQEHTG